MSKRLFKHFYKGMNNFSHTISIFVNSCLLCIVYFIGLGVVVITAKILRKNFLELKPSKESYWSNLNLGRKELKEYYRQF